MEWKDEGNVLSTYLRRCGWIFGVLSYFGKEKERIFSIELGEYSGMYINTTDSLLLRRHEFDYFVDDHRSSR